MNGFHVAVCRESDSGSLFEPQNGTCVRFVPATIDAEGLRQLAEGQGQSANP